MEEERFVTEYNKLINRIKKAEKFLERDENEEEYTYKELIELLDKGETMLIVINKD